MAWLDESDGNAFATAYIFIRLKLRHQQAAEVLLTSKTIQQDSNF
jgi:hypothetical protein